MEVVLLSVLVMIINIQVEALSFNSEIEKSDKKDGHRIPITESLLRDGKQDDTVKVPQRLNKTRKFPLHNENTEVVLSDKMKSIGRDGNQGQTIQLFEIFETSVFYLRTPLIENSEIYVKGDFNSKGRITIILGYDTFAVVQVDVFYPINGQTENKIVIEPPLTDNEPLLATDYFYEDMGVDIRFKAYIIESQMMSIFIGNSHFTILHLYKSLKDVKFVSSTGNITDVRFVQR